MAGHGVRGACAEGRSDVRLGSLVDVGALNLEHRRHVSWTSRIRIEPQLQRVECHERHEVLIA